jgi:hypothetical protein
VNPLGEMISEKNCDERVVEQAWDGYSFLKFQYAWLDNSGGTISCRLDRHLVSRENPFWSPIQVQSNTLSRLSF